LDGGAIVKYVLLFCSDGADTERFARLSDEERADQYGRVAAWFNEHRSKITGGNQLGWPTNATTVRWRDDGDPIVTDGPFLEGNEVIGGYAEIEVDDLDAALTMARTWPPRGAVEIRPVLDVG
jgi:hypothetical protein